MGLFPEDTFSDAEPELGFVCTETNPVRGAAELRRMVVAARGRRGITEGMREWAKLGWYGMAAFTVVRSACCQDPASLSTPTSHQRCQLDARLDALGEAVRARRQQDAQQALQDYGKAIHCLLDTGAAHFFGQPGMPRSSELTTFGKTLARALEP